MNNENIISLSANELLEILLEGTIEKNNCKIFMNQSLLTLLGLLSETFNPQDKYAKRTKSGNNHT